MILSVNKFYRCLNSKDFKFHLAFLWSLFVTSGFFLGVLSAPGLGDILVSFASDSVSVWGSAFFHLILILLAVVMVRHKNRLVLMLACLRGFGYGFIYGVAIGYFGYAGWLVCFLLNFTGVICSVVELWLWSSDLISISQRSRILFIIVCFVIILTAIWFDVFFLSSILSEVIIYY